MIGAYRTGGKAGHRRLVILQHTLIVEQKADLPSRHLIVQQHVFVQHLAELHILHQRRLDVLQHRLIDLLGVQIGILPADLRHVDPVHGNGVLQVFPEADDLVRGPGDIGRVRGVHRVAHQHLVVSHQNVRHDVAHVILHFLGQILVGGRVLIVQLRHNLGHRLLPLGEEPLVDALFQLCGVFLGKMCNIDNIIVNQGIVYIIDRNHDVGRAGVALNIFLRILDLGHQNAGQLLLQNLVGGHLKLLIDGQVDVVARLGILLLRHLQHPAHAVHIHLLVALGALKLRLHILLDTSLSDDIVELVILVFLLQALQLLCGGLSDIADDGGKILAVRIDSPAALLDVRALELVLVLQYGGHRLLRDVHRHGGRHVPLVAVG